MRSTTSFRGALPLIALLPNLLVNTGAVGVTVQQELVSEQEPTAGYLLYSLPPFTVTFTSSYSTNGLPFDATERSQLLTATLHSPLQIITTEFLMESFRIQIAKAKPRTNFILNDLTTPPPRTEEAVDLENLNAILDSFMMLDISVAVRASDHLSLATSEHGDGRRRQLEGAGEADYSFPSTTTSTVATTATSRSAVDDTELLQFEADFFTTAAFLEPVSQQGINNKPSNKEVSDVLGGWIQSTFTNDINIYKDDLINSDTGILEHLHQLHVETNSGAVFDPYTTGKLPRPASKGESPFGAPPNAAMKPSAIGAWSPSEKLFFTFLVMVSLCSIAGLLCALKKFRGRNKELARMMQGEFSHRPDDFAPQTSLSGRHSDEIMDILNASDRYLAEHRPDLLEAMNRTADIIHSGLVIPLAMNNDSQRPVERRYVTATNPFSYLYGASYFHSEKQEVEEHHKRNPRPDPMDGVELHAESVPHDEDLEDRGVIKPSDHAVSGFLHYWFQQVVGARSPEKFDRDEEFGMVHSGMDDLVIEECITQETIACDEDPSTYDFPYQDFPRQDGTPCLIYEETLNEEEEEQFFKNSGRESFSTTSYGENDPLTDDVFQQALSRHNSLGLLSNDSSFATESSTIDFEDVDTTTSTTTPLFGSDEVDDPSKFTDKLERLVAMRHRHYEKQKIVEKHREQRRAERAKQRAEKHKKQKDEMAKRDLLLRRHSLELDIQELEAAVGTGTSNQGPPYSATKVVTPTDSQGQQADLRAVQKPNLHRRTSSEPDAGLTPDTSAALNVIQPTRSADMEHSPSRFSARSVPSPRRLSQSARKPFPLPKHSSSDVFRPIGQHSPLRTSSNNGRTMLPPSNLQSPPIVSPASSMTDSGSSPGSASHASSASRSTPPLMMGSGSIRDGSSARRKKKHTPLSSASAALAKGFRARRSMSFGNLEEKKVDEEMQTIHFDGNNSNSSGNRLPPRRTLSNSRRTSNSPDVMVHGIYAQFAS